MSRHLSRSGRAALVDWLRTLDEHIWELDARVGEHWLQAHESFRDVGRMAWALWFFTCGACVLAWSVAHFEIVELAAEVAELQATQCPTEDSR